MSAGLGVTRTPACFFAELAAKVVALRVVGEGWQDKRPRCAARSVGCFGWLFSSFLHIARSSRTSPDLIFFNDFNVFRTSQVKPRERL